MPFVIIGLLILSIVITLIVSNNIQVKNETEKKELLNRVLKALDIRSNSFCYQEYDDTIRLTNRKSFNDYSDIKYLKETTSIEKIRSVINKKTHIHANIENFLHSNPYSDNRNSQYMRETLYKYLKNTSGYHIKVIYDSPAGKKHEIKNISIDSTRLHYLETHPELFMSKTEFNKLKKQKTADIVETKRQKIYEQVNSIIDIVSQKKATLVSPKYIQTLDNLVQKLLSNILVSDIQKISQPNSPVWNTYQKIVTEISNQITDILELNENLKEYYQSDGFFRLKETCKELMESQHEFNEYIDEKAKNISSLFGTKIVRNKTQNEDTYNYIRPYEKSITPFTTEVSNTVFSSAENNPIAYVIKQFYPNKSQYVEQIKKLRILIEELGTLQEAKDIIDNYKEDFAQYIQDVPAFVLQEDEDGFYSRLGFAIIDESVLRIEYKFVYTSNGGMAQRSFTIPMDEDNIIELIAQLENKLSVAVLAKEQRALMTNRLRQFIKKRDNYTCCICHNSIHEEPNLLLEIDHIIPISKGGLTTEDNLQTLCWKCNRTKGSKLIYYYT